MFTSAATETIQTPDHQVS